MELYPKNSRFVVALGHEAELIQEVVRIYERESGSKITIVRTESHSQHPGGLTQTLADCQSELQEPFVFHAVDTYFDTGPQGLEWLATTDRNTVVLGQVQHEGSYRVFQDGRFPRLTVPSGGVAYTGVAKIQDWRTFWSAFASARSTAHEESGEVLGLQGLSDQIITEMAPSWSDAGNPSALSQLLERTKTTDNVLPKMDEAIWNFGGRMFKFHVSPAFISSRLARSKYLSPYVPTCQSEGVHVFSYQRVPGQILSECRDIECFKAFLTHCADFWNQPLDGAVNPGDYNFDNFYRVKTQSRVHDYLLKYPEDAAISLVNGQEVKGIEGLLDLINWEVDFQPNDFVPCHGDLHPENVIHDHDSSGFTFLDWRQDIAGSTSGLGDIYYDFAKIMHGLIVDHGAVLRQEFNIARPTRNTADVRIKISEQKKTWSLELEKFVENWGGERRKMWLMTGLIFLNIATLHHENYDRFLFALGLLISSLSLDQEISAHDYISKLQIDKEDSFWSK